MKPRVIFYNVVLDSLDFGSNEAICVSRVHFDLEHGDELYSGLYIDIEEPVQTMHETDDMKVGRFESPIKINHKALERAVLKYYQSLVTSAGYGKHIARGMGFRSHGDVLGQQQVVEL